MSKSCAIDWFEHLNYGIALLDCEEIPSRAGMHIHMIPCESCHIQRNLFSDSEVDFARVLAVLILLSGFLKAAHYALNRLHFRIGTTVRLRWNYDK